MGLDGIRLDWIFLGRGIPLLVGVEHLNIFCLQFTRFLSGEKFSKKLGLWRQIRNTMYGLGGCQINFPNSTLLSVLVVPIGKPLFTLSRPLRVITFPPNFLGENFLEISWEEISKKYPGNKFLRNILVENF